MWAHVLILQTFCQGKNHIQEPNDHNATGYFMINFTFHEAKIKTQRLNFLACNLTQANFIHRSSVSFKSKTNSTPNQYRPINNINKLHILPQINQLHFIIKCFQSVCLLVSIVYIRANHFYFILILQYLIENLAKNVAE